MPTEYLWAGGAAVVTGVSETILTGANWTGDGNLTATLTDEAGATQTSVLATTAVTLEAQRDLFLTQLQAEVQTLFAAITWSSLSTTTILGTNKVPGVPSYVAVADTDTAGGITQNVDGTGNSVLSEGPEDRNVDGAGNYNSSNWLTAAGATSVKPANGTSNIKFSRGSWDMRYGLNDTNGYDEIRRTPKYTGTIGDPVNGYYWIADIDNAAAQTLYINAVKGQTWMTCIGENAFIEACPAGADSVKFGAASDLSGVYLSGPGCRGTVTCATGMALDNIEMVECPAATMQVNAVTSLDRVDVGAGLCRLDLGAVTPVIAIRAQTWGSGTIMVHSTVAVGSAACALAEVYGGRFEWNGEGILTLLKVHGGTFTLENSRADVATISTTNQTGGIVTEGGAQNAIWTTYNQNGGTANISASVDQWDSQAP